jgi:hypothetical protein
MLSRAVISFVVLATTLAPGRAQPATTSLPDALAALVRAYPNFLDRIDDNDLVWKDGTRMRIDDGKGPKSLDAMLADPDIKDIFSMRYPLGENGLAPDVDFDPGRVRHLPLLEKVYGNCRTSGFMADPADIVWLPGKDGRTVKFTRINGAAAALQNVSDELARLPPRFLAYLRPMQGTYNCRPIAGTNRPSPHGFGIAIDIAAAHSHYWRWSKPDADGRYPYRNEIPLEIVHIFEQHGFIWGGKWYHYDTMHFEYRPEIIAAAR